MVIRPRPRSQMLRGKAAALIRKPARYGFWKSVSRQRGAAATTLRGIDVPRSDVTTTSAPAKMKEEDSGSRREIHAAVGHREKQGQKYRREIEANLCPAAPYCKLQLAGPTAEL